MNLAMNEVIEMCENERKSLGLTIEEYAKKKGVTRVTMSNMLNGKLGYIPKKVLDSFGLKIIMVHPTYAHANKKIKLKYANKNHDDYVEKK